MALKTNPLLRGPQAMPCWKLVREKIPETITERERVYILKPAREDLDHLLRAKIVEEAIELAETGDPEEAADLLEALHAWLTHHGTPIEQVEAIRRRKKAVRGGLANPAILVDTTKETC